MTVGSRAVSGPDFSGHKEAILYRNHTEILTDQRILLDGAMYTFDQIDQVEVVRTAFYIPLQIMRGLALIVAMVCFGAIGVNIASDFAIIRVLLYGLVAGAAVGFVFMITTVVPMYVVRLTVGDKHVFMMHDTSKVYLERVKAAVLHGMKHH